MAKKKIEKAVVANIEIPEDEIVEVNMTRSVMFDSDIYYKGHFYKMPRAAYERLRAMGAVK